MRRATIISVDDDASFQTYLAHFLQHRGYGVETLRTGNELLVRLNSGPAPSAILLDVMLPDGDGIQIIEKIKMARIDVPVIMISGVGLVKPVVEAMKLGAADFLMKPFDETACEAAIENALQQAVLHASTSRSAPFDSNAREFITVNPKMRRLAEVVERVARTDVPILILGESGVGKEVLARHAHAHSGRDDKPFVKVNCAAVPNDLLESELFGYERGAFTGAVTDKTGKFEQAHRGTLLLDEIGEMSPHLQSKLLHVLQDGVFTRLGGTKSVRVDARIIATTNVKMAEAIAEGKFREDLYFRLNVITLDVPPLRERREDIPALCDHFMAKYRDRYRSDRDIPAELLNHFTQHDWPGNIRQLENCIKQFLVLPDHHSLLAELDSYKRPLDAVEQSDTSVAPQSFSLLDVGAAAGDRAERDLVRRVLEETKGNRKQAARRMNICYKALLNKMKRWAGADATAAPQEVHESVEFRG